MRDNKNSWIDSLSGDDLRARLAQKPIPVREAPPKKKKKLKNRLSRPLLPKLENPVNAEKAKASGKNVEVSLSFKIPKLPTRRIWQQYKKNTYAKVISALVVIILLNVVAVSIVKNHNNGRSVQGVTTGKSSATTPSYKPFLPGGEVANTNSQAYKYTAEKQLVGYTDKIGQNEILVTQQPLPEEFKDNPDGRVEIFAKNANYNELLQITGGRAHLGTSEKGPQFVVFHKNGLMIFLRSDKKLLNADWTNYINGLKQSK